MMLVRRRQKAELKRRARVRLDIRRIYPTKELPRRSQRRAMPLIACLTEGMRWLARRVGGRWN
jgi:hypothetical protein